MKRLSEICSGGLPARKFHIQTIDSALLPQWGNPRGLTFSAKGDNVFLASMDFERDRKHIWEEAPWTVSKHAVPQDDFDVSMKPSEIKFKRLPIWFTCDDLPFNWMNEARGKSSACQVGEFISLDLHGNGSSSGWGQSLSVCRTSFSHVGELATRKISAQRPLKEMKKANYHMMLRCAIRNRGSRNLNGSKQGPEMTQGSILKAGRMTLRSSVMELLKVMGLP